MANRNHLQFESQHLNHNAWCVLRREEIVTSFAAIVNRHHRNPKDRTISAHSGLHHCVALRLEGSYADVYLRVSSGPISPQHSYKQGGADMARTRITQLHIKKLNTDFISPSNPGNGDPKSLKSGLDRTSVRGIPGKFMLGTPFGDLGGI